MDERMGFGLYQSCGNMGSVGSVSVFGMLAILSILQSHSGTTA